MYDIPWSRPVRIKMPHGIQRNVDGPIAALDILDQEWPARRGRHYDAARSVCRAALERMTSSEAAREIFISASIEASVAVHSLLPYPRRAGSDGPA